MSAPASHVLEAELEAVATGTPEQVRRYHAGLLPEDELLALARAELFAPFSLLRRWSNGRDLRPGNVRHVKGCGAAAAGGPFLDRAVTFETSAATEITAADHVQLEAIRDLAHGASRHPWCQADKVAFQVEPRAHWGTCSSCGRETVKHTAIVSIVWAGRTLSREYSLVP